MVSDRFTILIDELGKAMGLNLKPDSNNACISQYKDGLEVRLDPEPLGEMVYVWSDLGALPPTGKYRENIFKEALKANGLPPPKTGIFAFNSAKESLTLFEQLSIQDLTAIQLADFIETFAQRARIWKEGITRGEIPSFQATATSSSRGSGLFGLR